MKKLILVLTAFISMSASAQFLTYQEFSRMTEWQKVEVLKEYKNFLADQKIPLGDDEKTVTMISFIDEAIAAGDFNCFFAGWPSQLRTSGGRKVCTSPANSNPSYKSQASQCSSGQMLCQPILFGDVGCIPAATKAQKNMAFASCDRKFKASGKTIADVVKDLSSADKSAAADEVFSLVSSVCTSGPQAVKPMCRNLQNKVAALKSARPAVVAVAPVEKPEDKPAPAQQGPAGPKADEETDGETPVAADAPAKPNEVVAAVGAATAGLAALANAGNIPCDEDGISTDPSKFKKLSCPHAPVEGLGASLEELEPDLTKYGIEMVGDSSPSPENVRQFIAEVKKFPESLFQELKDKGAKIRIFEGEGVTVDKTFPLQIANAGVAFANRQVASTEGWDKIPGSGGSVAPEGAKEPTRIAVNHLYDRHGSSNLVLHEHAHNLDSIYGRHTISNSAIWHQMFSGPDKDKIQTLLTAICSNNYCSGEGKTDDEKREAAMAEGFAELFAYYHSCDKAKESVKRFVPDLAEFFEKLKNVKEFVEKSKNTTFST